MGLQAAYPCQPTEASLAQECRTLTSSSLDWQTGSPCNQIKSMLAEPLTPAEGLERCCAEGLLHHEPLLPRQPKHLHTPVALVRDMGIQPSEACLVHSQHAPQIGIRQGRAWLPKVLSMHTEEATSSYAHAHTPTRAGQAPTREKF